MSEKEKKETESQENITFENTSPVNPAKLVETQELPIKLEFSQKEQQKNKNK